MMPYGRLLFRVAFLFSCVQKFTNSNFLRFYQKGLTTFQKFFSIWVSMNTWQDWKAKLESPYSLMVHDCKNTVGYISWKCRSIKIRMLFQKRFQAPLHNKIAGSKMLSEQIDKLMRIKVLLGFCKGKNVNDDQRLYCLCN